jgi:hypothetical protein
MQAALQVIHGRFQGSKNKHAKQPPDIKSLSTLELILLHFVKSVALPNNAMRHQKPEPVADRLYTCSPQLIMCKHSLPDCCLLAPAFHHDRSCHTDLQALWDWRSFGSCFHGNCLGKWVRCWVHPHTFTPETR